MKKKLKKTSFIFLSLVTAAAAAISVSGCTEQLSSVTETTSANETTAAATVSEATTQEVSVAQTKRLSEGDISVSDTINNSEDGGHAITADGESADYSHTLVTKTGDSSGDNADFYGENAAIFATNGGTLNLSNMVVKTDGTHANAVFSYGNGTTVNISDSYINTTGNCSGGLMTTGGGTMNASDLTIETSGNSSAAIRSDRGGGTVNVSGGYYSTSGKGSPVVYSTADITVSDAEMVSVMIYQSMSGDAAQGLSGFTMNGGTLVNKNGDVFFVNNTATEINLSNASITNEGDGVFLRAAAAGWGKEGSNGGQVTLNAANQTINGDILVDSISTLNLYLKSGSSFTGAVNPDGQEGEVYVEIESGSTWMLTADSYISSLTCGADSIVLNGHKLYVNGEEYTEGTASSGQAIEIKVSESSGGGHEAPPDGKGGGNKPEGNPPAKPD